MPLTIDQKREHQRLATQRFRAAHPDRPRLAYQRYYEKHPDRVCAKSRAYRVANKEKVQAYYKAYNAAHREERRAYRKAYYAAHPEEQRAYSSAYTKAFPESSRNQSARRRALQRGAQATLTVAQWRAIVVGYKGKCAYCGVKSEKLTQDHVIPFSRGGHHIAENVVPACLPCNLHKYAGLPPLIPPLRLLL